MNIKDELKNELISNTLSVKWKVSSDIGPNWIGSNREICFYKNSKPIDENLAYSFLKESLIEKLNIPEKSEDDTIEGWGDLFMLDNDLIIKYRISYTIPYDYPHKYENGEVILISE
ncbi:hypothetical protein D3C86_572420 [compost metagenome]